MNRSILETALRGGCLLLFATFLSCGRLEVNIAVNLPALPTNTASIDAILKLDGRQVARESFSQALEGAGPRLGFKLPAGTRGRFEIELLAKDGAGCPFARSFDTVEITGDKLQTIDAAFDKLPKPVISQVAPRYVPNDADTKLTVTGEYLYACSEVLVDELPVKDLQFISPTEISLTVPARKGTCGPMAVKLTGKDTQIALAMKAVNRYTPTPTFAGATLLAAPNTSSEMLLEDFTGDGELDIVLLGTSTSPMPKLLVGRGNGTFNTVVNVPMPTVPIDFTAHITAADVNGDGKTDLLFTCHSPGTPAVDRICVSLQMNGTLPRPVYTDVPIPAVKMTVGDVDGDTKPDLVSIHATMQPYKIGVLRGNGDGTFSSADAASLSANLFAPAVGRLDSIELADFNRDGKRDIVAMLTYTADPMLGLQVALGTGNRTFGMFNGTSACNGIDRYGIGDANGDGIVDIFAGHTLCTANGSGDFDELAFFSDMPWIFPQIVDINGDGLLDVAVIEDTPAKTSTMLRNSNGTYRTGPSISPGPVDGFRVGDINGDGVADLVQLLYTQQQFDIRFGVCN